MRFPEGVTVFHHTGSGDMASPWKLELWGGLSHRSFCWKNSHLHSGHGMLDSVHGRGEHPPDSSGRRLLSPSERIRVPAKCPAAGDRAPSSLGEESLAAAWADEDSHEGWVKK